MTERATAILAALDRERADELKRLAKRGWSYRGISEIWRQTRLWR